MLAAWVVPDEMNLRRTALLLMVGGAIGALALARAAALWPWSPALQAGADHWPLALAALAAVAALLPAVLDGPAPVAWPARALAVGLLAALAALAQLRWPAGLPAGRLALLVLAGQGAATGLLFLLGLLPLLVRLRPLRLWWAARSPAQPGGATADPLLPRALALWARIERARPAPEIRRALARALALWLVAARRWRALGGGDIVPDAATLAREQMLLAGRRQQTDDPIARVRYAEARRSLERQSGHLAAIAATRERLRAQLHRQLEAMEALHLAAVTARVASADRGGPVGPLGPDGGQGDPAAPVLAEIQRLCDELDAAREAEADPAVLT